MADEITVINHLPQLADALHKALAEAVRDAATAMAQSYASNAPEKSGFMASTAYTVTNDASTYGANVNGSGDLLPAVDTPSDDQTALAAVAAPYAAYVEYGTVSDSAQPAFHPAFDVASKTLSDALDNLQSKLAGEGIN